jgi:hypothetical protein
MNIGDLVINPPNPHWGIGIVIELEPATGQWTTASRCWNGTRTARVQWNHGGEMWVMFKNLEALCKSEI